MLLLDRDLISVEQVKKTLAEHGYLRTRSRRFWRYEQPLNGYVLGVELSASDKWIEVWNYCSYELGDNALKLIDCDMNKYFGEYILR